MKRIPKIKLVPVAESPEAQDALGYKWNKEVGYRHFLGGDPGGRMQPEIPSCPNCKVPMTFYAQIDSIGDNFDLADCMVIHTYVCFDCFSVKSELVQV